MLSVEPALSSSPRHQPGQLQEEVSDIIVDSPHVKPQPPQRKYMTPLNIMIFFALIALLAVGAYVIVDFTKEKDMKNSITEAHSKIITNSESGSSTGGTSQTSKSSSSSNDKPNAKSFPASKGVITSNPGLLGKSGAGDEDPNDDEEDNGDKRSKKLRDHSGSGSTGEEDSE